MMKTQTLRLDTIAGPRPITAPAGWDFDKTAIIAWARLLNHTREQQRPQKLKRDDHVIEGQIVTLTNLLASALGMAPFYWRTEARKIVRSGHEQ